MDLFSEIKHILRPIVIVGGIVIFIILRMQYKYRRGTLGKKKSTSAQILLNSLIPLGMITGCIIAILFGLFSSIPLITVISWGAGLGLLLGYFAYEVFS